ncbi:MAG: hypothetical protein Salg2KO_11730 [Salibacteraceae bacterium]
MRHFTLIIWLAAFTLNVGAQSSKPSKLPLSLQWIKSDASPQEPIHLYLKGDHSEIRGIVENLNGWVKRSVGDYLAVVIPYTNVFALEGEEAVKAVHFELSKGQPLLNESLANTRINMVHDGSANLHSSLTGKGVIVGIIDAGLDFSHPDFLNQDSSTRVLELWDQTLPFDAQRTPSYGYGQVYDSADINAGNCPHQDQVSYFGHGTNTAGIAVSNGNSDPDYTGAAPEADIIVVSSNFNSFSWTNTVADAVDYIFKRAEFYGKPCVINASLGSYIGSHDGRDIATQEIESIISDTTGRVMVCAAGNSGELDPYHLGYTVTGDTNFTWFEPKSNGTIFFELFSDTGSFEEVYFAIGADKTSPNFEYRGATEYDVIENRLNTTVSDTLLSTSGNMLAVVQSWAEEFNGTYRLQFYIIGIDSLDYNFRLSMTGSGDFDLWSTSEYIFGWNDMVHSGLPSTNEFNDIALYKLPDSKQQIVSNWACSEKVVTVGNYTNRTTYVDVDGNTVEFSSLTAGAIAASSSAGPARTGAIKPEITAPGELTLTAGANYQLAALLGNISFRNRVAISGLHHRAGGTSSASPIVAGIAALFFESCPYADWQDFKNALEAGAVTDNFTGNVPNDRWGNGKADAINTLKYIQPNPEVSATDDEICAGDSTEITVDATMETYSWNNGMQGQSISVKDGILYFAEVSDDKGCKGYSDTIAIIKRAKPVKPTVTIEGDQPACANQTITLSIADEYGSYAWNTNQFTNEIQPNQTGKYACVVSNIHGCQNTSDSITVVFFEGELSPRLSLKANNELVMHDGSSDSTLIYGWRLNDDPVANENDSILKVFTEGIYSGFIIDTNGCEWHTDWLTIGALGTSDPTLETTMVYPNPLQDRVTVNGIEDSAFWVLYNANGVHHKSGFVLKERPSLDLSDLPPGSYFLEINSEQKRTVFPLIKR